MKKQRLVEMYVGWSDHTWDTTLVYVDADLDENEAVKAAKEQLYATLTGPVAFIGLYFLEERDG